MVEENKIEMEDDQGNVMSAKTYNDLRAQGIIQNAQFCYCRYLVMTRDAFLMVAERAMETDQNDAILTFV